MKKWLVFIVLLSHINCTMFIAQVDEVDVYDKAGRQIDDINSLAEYINEAITGNHHQSAHDEDDDNAWYFHIEKAGNYSFCPQFIELKKPPADNQQNNIYPSRNEALFNAVLAEKPTPPPKA